MFAPCPPTSATRASRRNARCCWSPRTARRALTSFTPRASCRHIRSISSWRKSRTERAALRRRPFFVRQRRWTRPENRPSRCVGRRREAIVGQTMPLGRGFMPDTLPNIQVNTNLFIDNKFVPAASGKTFDVLNPHDESLLAKVAEGDRADVDRAVSAAQKAFPVWSNMAASARGALIYKLAQAIEEDGENLALIETLDTGHPIRDTRNLDVFRTAAVFRYFAGMADKYEGFVVPAEPGFLTYITRDPIGVVGLIVPWNFPLMFTSWKMGPALAAGNCLVLKPAELTPLTTLR